MFSIRLSGDIILKYLKCFNGAALNGTLQDCAAFAAVGVCCDEEEAGLGYIADS